MSEPATDPPALPDGWILVTKEDCPTCRLLAPAVDALREGLGGLTVVNQDGDAFPPVPDVLDDRDLAWSWHLGVELVPTLLHRRAGTETVRLEGWERQAWTAATGLAALGAELPEHRPGCGSRTTEPGVRERLLARFEPERIAARRVGVDAERDTVEACYDLGWSDGLPVVPPTPERVLRMLQGTTRDPAETLGAVPPDLVPVTVEKVAINAVLAGCRPEYLPVVLAAVEAALDEAFCMHGLLCTTYFSGPMVVVNGPVARRIGMNWGGNALGQGNRANATIGRALQLVIRNVGGGRPGEVDRATLGNPGKYTFCFAEDESDPWTTLAEDRGIAPGRSAVTLFAADGVQGIVDQQARDPESLANSFAAGLSVVSHPRMVQAADAFLVVSPEHARVFHDAGWSKQRLVETLRERLTHPVEALERGLEGIAEGLPTAAVHKLAGRRLCKFRDGGLTVVRAGGSAGMFSAIIGGWGASGAMGSAPVTKEIRP